MRERVGLANEKLLVVMLSELVSGSDESTNRHIAAYILTHMQQLQNFTIRDLAAETNVSPSSVSRFCREIGLRDFDELKSISAGIMPQFRMQSYAPTPKERLDDYYSGVTESLRLVRDSLDMGAVRRLCEDIRRYPRVSLFGVMKSETAAMNLQTDLLLMGKLVTTKVSFAHCLRILEQADEQDLIVLFSYEGKFFDFFFSRRPAPEMGHGAKVYMITSNLAFRDARLPGEVLWFRAGPEQSSHPWQLQMISSIIAEDYAHLLAESGTVF